MFIVLVELFGFWYYWVGYQGFKWIDIGCLWDFYQVVVQLFDWWVYLVGGGYLVLWFGVWVECWMGEVVFIVEIGVEYCLGVQGLNCCGCCGLGVCWLGVGV